MNPRIISALAIAILIPVSSPAEPTTFFGMPLDFGEGSPARAKQQLQSAADTPHQPSDQRILILFDVSRSVLNKARESNFPMSRIKEEVLKLVDTCPDGASIGIIQFTQNYKPHSDKMVRLDERNRAALRQWVQKEWNETGAMASGGDVKKNKRGVIGVLEFASAMKPDQIYLVSDASFQWKEGGFDISVPWRDFESAVSSISATSDPATLNFIGFQTTPEDRAKITAISRATGGQVAFIQ
jgi:hypothetical protein